MPSREDRIRQLVLRGMSVPEAEGVVDAVDQREGRILPPGEAEIQAAFSPEDMEADRQWVFYTPDIPDRLRRMWTARQL